MLVGEICHQHVKYHTSLQYLKYWSSILMWMIVALFNGKQVKNRFSFWWPLDWFELETNLNYYKRPLSCHNIAARWISVRLNKLSSTRVVDSTLSTQHHFWPWELDLEYLSLIFIIMKFLWMYKGSEVLKYPEIFSPIYKNN